MNLPAPSILVEAAGLPPSSHLQRVLRSELARLEGFVPPDPGPRAPLATDQPGRFERALRAAACPVIAEYKQGSPSLGPFAAGTPLEGQLLAYQAGGAAAFSILVEPAHFLGSAEHLRTAAGLGPPCLYKGFVLSAAQLAEAAACGAAAVLLIARVLRGATVDFAAAARELGLEPFVELHDLTEVAFAAAAGARIVGINARDLATFNLGQPGAEGLREAFPSALLVRESGLATPEDVRASFDAGFDAALVGEALMRSADPAGFLRRVAAGPQVAR